MTQPQLGPGVTLRMADLATAFGRFRAEDDRCPLIVFGTNADPDDREVILNFIMGGDTALASLYIHGAPPHDWDAMAVAALRDAPERARAS